MASYFYSIKIRSVDSEDFSKLFQMEVKNGGSEKQSDK